MSEREPTLRTMRVSAVFGARFELLPPDDPDAVAVPARTRGKRLRPVTGDLVQALPLEEENDWLIESIAPRDNLLDRTDSRGRQEILAANISLMIVVTCARPAPDFFLVDRYLAAAEGMSCAACVVWNKSDLAAPEPTLEEFARAGYPVIACSVTSNHGLDVLREHMCDQRSILVGQSGVGKSSLINALADDTVQQTGAVSSASDEGRHTTVAARLVRLAAGLEVIDSPGVRDYAPRLVTPRDASNGFREIRRAAVNCRFADCAHRAEPDCAVKAGVASGDIADRRYRSYLRLMQLTRQLQENRY